MSIAAAKAREPNGMNGKSVELEDVVYTRQMLGELRALVDAEGCEVLCYLIEMAYLEAGDLQMALRASDVAAKRDKPARMPL
jgi:hypothetical protein